MGGTPALRRVLRLPALVLYGLGVIVGAGIYVAVGGVIAAAGPAAPFAFLLAGLAAALTGLCYAELGSRFPEAAGSPAYLRHAFGSDRLAQAAGVALAAAVAVSAASIAHGAALYAAAMLPLPNAAIAALLVVLFTAVACLDVRQSAGLAAAIAVLEIAGLMVAAASGLAAGTADADALASLLPAADAAQLRGVVAGAFVAFFAFLGFETLVNMAEETVDAPRTVPRAVILAVAVSTALYVLVAVATVLAAPGGGDTPLLATVARHGPAVERAFAVVALLSIANGVLVEIMMLARLFYGMAGRGWLPARLARVSARRGAPAAATLLAGAVVLAFVLALRFQHLVALTNTITLAIFALVGVALWRLHRRGAAPPGAFRVPRFVPPLAAAVSLLLILAQFAG